MSVKCGYSDKYYPLLMGIFLNDSNEHTEFKNFVESYFSENDINRIYELFMEGGVNNSSSITPIFKPKDATVKTGILTDTSSDSPMKFFIGKEARQYNKMINNFAKKLISVSIFDLATENFVEDPNKNIEDTTLLNKEIFKYKKELLKIVSNYLSESLIDLDTINDVKEIEDVFNSIIIKFEERVNNIVDKDDTYYNAFNAYVTLKTFEKLLATETPFIGINPLYEKSSIYSKQRYTYVGPSVKQFTNFSETQYMDASDATSDLCKILLRYFPKVNENNQIIEDTSISLSGFNSVMLHLKQWAEESTDQEVADELTKGTKMDMQKLISKYENALDTNKDISPEHKTYLRSTLRGIKKYVFNPKMRENIKFMFTHLMEKTVLSSYIGYQENMFDGEKRFGARNMTERPILMQKYFIDDVVTAASTYWAENKNKFDEFLQKYNITIYSDTIKIGDVTITQGRDNIISTSGLIDNFNEIFENFVQLLIADDFEEVAKQVYPNKDHSVLSLYTPVLATVLFNSYQKFISPNNRINSVNNGQLKDLSRVLNVINGADTVNVIKNAEGNNLPLYQMVCLSYLHKNINHELKKQSAQLFKDGLISPYESNVVFNNIQNVKSPKIRSEVTFNGRTVQSAQLTDADVIHLSMVYDFYQGLVSEQSQADEIKKTGIVGIQSHVYSDKNKHFVMQFDLNSLWNCNGQTLNFKTILDNYFKQALDPNSKDNSELLLEPIKNAYYESNKQQMEAIVWNLLSDYKTVFKENTFDTLSDLKSFLSSYFKGTTNGKKNSIETLRERFAQVNIEFEEEVHASKVGGVFTVNETLEYFNNIFSNRDKFDKFYNEQFQQFLKDSENAWKTISKDKNLIRPFKDSKFCVYDSYNDTYQIEREVDGRINPLVSAYFLMDSFLANEYNKMMVGNVYAHPNKNKESVNADNYNQHSLASRWISQVKRMVIYGATYHSYAQGLKYGVKERVKMAVMPDIGSNVRNMVGMSSDVDSMDGSGYVSPIFSRQENASLLDAAVGANKKTIYHDIGAKHGTPKLLKWAEYEITNALRRNSSTISLENMYRKMHSGRFNPIFNYDSGELNNYYFRDNKTGKFYQILNVKIDGGIATRTIVEVNKLGKEIGKKIIQTSGVLSNVEKKLNLQELPSIINTIYKIDLLFGGAWGMEINPLTENLQYTEKNKDLLTDIVCDQDLSDNMIAILVNKSAIKVGTTNLNSKKAWFEDTIEDENGFGLRYTTMSTKFGGVQMDADHELDEAEVTEMTQMISGLEQNGYTHDIAMQTYEEIGKFCFEAVAKIQNIFKNEDYSELYKIFGKAIIKSFQNGDKDTLGLAQAFVQLASENFDNFADKKVKYKIPFSSSSINGIFNSTVTSSLIKEAIRRHYNGVAAVLNPAHNVMQYYTVNGNHYRKEELLDIIPSLIDERFKNVPIEDFLTKIEIVNINGEKELNPFLQVITKDDPVDFEDTIVVVNSRLENGEFNKLGERFDKEYEVFKIEDYDSYDYYRNYEERPMFRWTLQPRNLKGSDTTFIANGRKYSMFESPYSKILFYFFNSKLGAQDLESAKSEIFTQVKKQFSKLNIPLNEERINKIATERWNLIYAELQPFLTENSSKNLSLILSKVKQEVLKKQQLLLNRLSDGFYLNWGGIELSPEETEDGSFYTVHPAQIVMGKLYAKQLGLLPGDSISKIKELKEKFFEDRIKGYYKNDNSNSDTYDWILYDGSGEKLYVKLKPEKNGDKKLSKIFKDKLSPISNYTTIDGIVYKDGKELCSAQGKQFVSYTNKNNEYNLVIVDSIDAFNELKNTKAFINIHRNYNLNNYKDLVKEKYNIIPEEVTITLPNKEKTKRSIYNSPIVNLSWITEEGKRIWRNIAEFDKEDELIKTLLSNQEFEFNKDIVKNAKNRYDAFEQSLKFVGTRIPCQSMQSFAPMEIVAFTDSETNEVYVPTNIFYLQGSDLDIDKQYILGYSISDNGVIYKDDNVAPYLKADSLRNKVVDNIFRVILNAKNQINLTMPITTDRMQELAGLSQMGEAAKVMSPFNPASKYLMQIQNMVGKAVIGNVATALKSFFALSNVYNSKFREIYRLITNEQHTQALDLLNKYTFIKNGKLITLANVNVEMFKDLIFDINVPEQKELSEKLSQIIEYEDSLPDQSMLLGELLNAATDNAKELILKKINADTNWVDVYTISFMLGENLLSDKLLNQIKEHKGAINLDNLNTNNVGELMISKNITNLVERFTSSIFDEDQNFNKVEYVRKNAYQSSLPEYQKLLDKIIAADEVRILGKILKINQGMPTNTSDLFMYIKSIEKYIESRFNKDILDWKNKALLHRLAILASFKQENNLNLSFEEIESLSNSFDTPYQPNFKNTINSVNNEQELKTWIAKYWHNVKIDPNLSKEDKNYQNSISRLLNWLKILYDSSKKRIEENWIRFDLIRFIIDENYKKTSIDAYEKSKINFNILEIIDQVPHFKEMFKVLALNKEILNTLSIRNRLEDWVWNNYIHQTSKGDSDITKSLTKEEVRAIKNQVDKYLINSWIKSKQIEILIPKGVSKWPNGGKLVLNTDERIENFRKYMESFVIPYLKENLPNNTFISKLTFGLKLNDQGEKIPFYRLPFNMVQVDNTQKTRLIYEDCLSSFNDLKNIQLEGINYNLVNLFYLYNLIVNRDRFGPTSLTRIFEDLISAPGNEELWVYDFNQWLDNQKFSDLTDFFQYLPLNIIKESTPVIENTTFGFKNTDEISQLETEYENEVESQISPLFHKPEIPVRSYYNTQPSIRAKLLSLVQMLNTKNLVITNNAELKEKGWDDINAKGFIKDGKIYINEDLAEEDTIIHELGHIYLAVAKMEHPDEYYELLNKVRETDLWKEMREREDYKNKKGSDFDEEVLATMISNYYKNVSNNKLNKKSENNRVTYYITNFSEDSNKQIVNFKNRYFTIVNIGETNIPFYLSAKTKKWEPFLGVNPININKTNNYFNSDILEYIGSELDKIFNFDKVNEDETVEANDEFINKIYSYLSLTENENLSYNDKLDFVNHLFSQITPLHVSEVNKMGETTVYKIVNSDDAWHIYDNNGKEVFTNAKEIKDRNRIIGKLSLNLKQAVQVSYKGKSYIVNKDFQIMSIDGDVVQLVSNHEDRIAINNLAAREFKLRRINANVPKVAVSEKYEAPKKEEFSNLNDNSSTKNFDKLPNYRGNTMTYAGIGSRETPVEIKDKMTKIAQKLEKLGYTLNTGKVSWGDDGADQAFAKGTDKKELFGPETANNVTRVIAKEIHPNPNALKNTVLNLMASSTNQVFGKNLDTPVDFVLYYAKPSNNPIRPQGGTGQAVEMANRKGIPTINMIDSNWEEQLINVLKNNKPINVEENSKLEKPYHFSYARTSNNNYEVSSRGDKRFSALYAKFKNGTIIDGVDVSGMTIEDVYQKVIKKSGKGKAPAENSIVHRNYWYQYFEDSDGDELQKDYNLPNGLLNRMNGDYITKSKGLANLTEEELEDISYYMGYLPLWQEWAKQNPDLIEELANKAKGKVLTDAFANTNVSQARALADILNQYNILIEVVFNTNNEIKNIGTKKEYKIFLKTKYPILSWRDMSKLFSKEGIAEFAKWMNEEYSFKSDVEFDPETRPKSSVTYMGEIKNHEILVNLLGGTEIAETEISDVVKSAKSGISYKNALELITPFFTKSEQDLIKEGLNGKNLQVISASRNTDMAFFSNDIIKFLEENSKLALNDPKRINVIEIWSKHDGMPIANVLAACKKYRVAPIVSFSITGLGGSEIEPGVLKYDDLLPLIKKLIDNDLLNPSTTTIRIDPILVGKTNLEDIKNIINLAKSYGIKKFVTSLVQSYGYLQGTASDRHVIDGINNALESANKPKYDWDKYYGIVTAEDVAKSNAFRMKYLLEHPEIKGRNDEWKIITNAGVEQGVRYVFKSWIGKYHFIPKISEIEKIGKYLIELNKDPEIEIETCAFYINGLNSSKCLDPLIIEKLTNVDIIKNEKYNKDESRPACMCYGAHFDMFKVSSKCASSCAYCYASHSIDNPLIYYDNNGNLKNNTDFLKSLTTVDVFNLDPRVQTKEIFEVKKEEIEINEEDVVQEALNLVSPEYKEFINSDILPSLDETLFTNYSQQQKIATVKNKLTEQNIIEENCR